MEDKEVDQRLVDDITLYYIEKKRLFLKNYNLISTPAENENFREAARLCDELEMDPAIFVQLLYDRMGDKKAFFSSKHLRGTAAKTYLTCKKGETEFTWKIEITNDTVDPEAIFNYQKELAMVYISRGEDPASVLIDSSLKFFAWFRILATPNPVPEIIDKYKHIAKKELTSKLLDFFKKEGLDLNRLQ